jgi:hypothetical protein|tara:strand:- start:741 stop:905 length:165 start_codon:yes stop_codon:yes gene_type:complete
MINEEKMNDTELDFYTNTFYNFGREKTTKWKTDNVIDKLIYKELKKGQNNELRY